MTVCGQRKHPSGTEPIPQAGNKRGKKPFKKAWQGARGSWFSLFYKRAEEFVKKFHQTHACVFVLVEWLKIVAISHAGLILMNVALRKYSIETAGSTHAY